MSVALVRALNSKLPCRAVQAHRRLSSGQHVVHLLSQGLVQVWHRRPAAFAPILSSAAVEMFDLDNMSQLKQVL